MTAISLSNLLTAFGITFAAGLATVLGSALVFFSKTPSPRVLAFGLAFAGGAMVYVSLTEIFGKSRDAFVQAAGEQLGFTYTTFAFLAGVILVMLIDRLIPNPHETLDPHDKNFKPKKSPAYCANRHNGGVGDYHTQLSRGLGNLFCYAGKSVCRLAFGVGDCDTQYPRGHFHCRACVFCHAKQAVHSVDVFAIGLG